MKLTLPAPRTLLRLLLWAVVVLHVLSFGSNFIYHGLGLHNPVPKFTYITQFLNVDKEKNLPTWFSAGVLLLAACVLWEISAVAKASGAKFARHWKILSLIFVFLSLDETSQVHEWSRNSGILDLGEASYLSWIVYALPFVILVALSYLRFLAHLPSKVRWLVVAGGVLFVTGSIVLEIIGAFTGKGVAGQRLPGYPYLEYLMAAQAEELLEMVGVITFLYAIATYLQQHTGSVAGPTAPAQATAARADGEALVGAAGSPAKPLRL
jgi:hypothetical protein